MMTKNYHDDISESNVGILLEGKYAGFPSYYEIPEIKEILIDGKWVLNPEFDLEKVKKSEVLYLENRLLGIYKDKQICENNNLVEKFNQLSIEQEKLKKQREALDVI